MFNLSFSEIFLIIILLILFIKPSEVPFIIKNVKKAFNKFLELKSNISDELESLKDDIQEIEDDLLDNDKIIKNEKKEKGDDNAK